MDTGQKGEQAIKELVEEQRGLLGELVSLIDTLVERVPAPTESTPNPEQRPSNVFDEIINTLHKCRALARGATEKVQEGIINKVC